MRRLLPALGVLVCNVAAADQRAELVYSVTPPRALRDAVANTRARLRDWGIGTAAKRGGSLVVRLPLVRDAAELAAIETMIATRGVLEVAPIASDSATMKQIERRIAAEGSPAGISLDVDTWRDVDERPHSDYYLLARDGARSGREILDGFLSQSTGMDRSAIVYQRIDLVSLRMPGRTRFAWRTYVLDARQRLVVAPTDAIVTTDGVTLKPDIQVRVSRGTAGRLLALTRKNLGNQLVILIDGQLSSAPIIASEVSALSVLPPDVPPDQRLLAAHALAVALANPRRAMLIPIARTVAPRLPCAGPAECKKQCDAGVGPSCTSAGDHFGACLGAAFEGCDLACTTATPKACLDLAEWLVKGPARVQNHALAADLFQRACAAGDDYVIGCMLAAEMHFHPGNGMPRRVDRMRDAMQMACEQRKSLDACAELERRIGAARLICSDGEGAGADMFCEYLSVLDPSQAAFAREKQAARAKKP